jgi:hypothetical protein
MATLLNLGGRPDVWRLALAVAVVILRGDVYASNLVTVNKTTSPPKIDGHIADHEWDDAASLYGFVDDIQARGTLSSRQSTVSLAYDDRAVYVAVSVSLDEGQTLKADTTERDGPIWTDDDVEVTFQPSADNVYRVLGNAAGVIADFRNRSPDWNGAWQYTSSVAGRVWTTELSIPFAELGLDGPPADGDTWGFNVNHGWQNPVRWTSWNRAAGAFDNPDGFGQLRFMSRAPVVRLRALGAPAKGTITLACELIASRGAAASARFDLSIGEQQLHHQQVDLAPTSRQIINVEKDLLESIASGMTHIGVRVMDAQGQLNYAATIPFELRPPLDLQWGYFSDRQTLRLDIDFSGLRGDVRGLTARFVATPAMTDEPALTNDYALPHKQTKAELTAELGALPDGEYRMTMRLRRDDLIVGSRSFDFRKRSKDPWDGNRIGIVSTPPPPWSAMTTAPDNTVTCWARQYTFGDHFLPRRIISLDESLLTAPITLKGTAHGKPIVWTTHGSSIESANDVEAHILGTARSKYLEVRTRVTIEYDGMMRVDLDLARTQDLTPLSELTLAIPLKADRAIFMQNAQISAFEHTGRRLDSEQGELFRHGFLNNIWLGDYKRGLQWFAESDQGWQNVDDDKAIQVVREGDTVKLLIHLINDQNYLLDWPIQFTFGLHATPTRPVDPVTRRRFVLNNMGDPWFADYNTYAYLWPNSRLKPGDSGMKWFGFPEPIDDDKYKEYLQRRLRDHGWKPLPYVYQTTLGDPSPMLQYHQQWMLQPRWWYHTSERGRKTYSKEELAKGYMRSMTKICVNIPQVRDYLVWAYAKFILEFDIDGFYCDHVQPFGCQSREHAGGTCVYQKDTEWLGPRKIFATREIYKRIYTVGKQKNPDFMVVANMKKSRLMAIHSFVDVAMPGETFVSRNPLDYLELVSFDSVVAEDMGTQWGLIPCYLMYTQGPKHYDPYGPRSGTVGLFFMHDIWSYIAGACQPYRKKALRVFRDEFDIDADDVVFHPYWDNRHFMTDDTVMSDGVEVSFYHRTRKNSSIWGVFNTTKQPQRVKVGVALKMFGLDGAAIIVSDPFGDREVVMADNDIVELEIPGRRIAYFQIDPK